jgi:hypothetical protein
LKNGKVGSDYNTQLSVSGVSGVQTWIVSVGKLPDGLNLSAIGAITGNPTKAGSFDFTAQVTDDKKSSASQQFTIIIEPQSSITSFCCTSTPGTNYSEVFLIALVGLSYWMAMVVVRWHRIAQPSREFLRAKIAGDLADLSLYPLLKDEPPGDRDQIRYVLLQAGLAISPGTAGRSIWYRAANFLLWSRGEEMAAWTYLHNAEVKTVNYMPLETVTTRLEAVEQQLRTFDDPICLAIANNVHAALTATNPASDLTRLRALLVVAITSVYSHSDASASDDISWQNKTSWLVGAGIFLLIVLTIAVPNHSILLIVGGVGGLVSRMTRSLDRKSVPTDYGASWTTLFLSPVSGALGAWAGVLLTEFAVSLQVLGDAFKSDFVNPCNTHTLAIAFVFGFSERLLDGVLDKLEEKSGAVPPRVASVQPSTSTELTGGLGITPTVLPQGTVGVDYPGQLTASGTSGPLTWTLADDDKFPDGLNWKSNSENPASIVGKPTKSGTFVFTVQVSDQSNKTAKQSFTVVIVDAPPGNAGGQGNGQNGGNNGGMQQGEPGDQNQPPGDH